MVYSDNFFQKLLEAKDKLQIYHFVIVVSVIREVQIEYVRRSKSGKTKVSVGMKGYEDGCGFS